MAVEAFQNGRGCCSPQPEEPLDRALFTVQQNLCVKRFCFSPVSRRVQRAPEVYDIVWENFSRH
eukprot:4757906-Prymnesium_polylepis.1